VRLWPKRVQRSVLSAMPCQQSGLCSKQQGAAAPESTPKDKDVAGSAFMALPPRCSGFAASNVPCGLRQTPCLYYSRAAANARVRSAGVLTRSQLISKVLSAVFPSFSVSIFAVKPSSPRLLFYCAAACGTAPAFSAFRPAVVSARRKPERRRHRLRRIFL